MADRKRFLRALVAGFPILLAGMIAAAAPPFVEGKVVRVTAGDALVVATREGTAHEVRLDGIDAPEPALDDRPGQPYGDEAAGALMALTYGKRVRVEIVGTASDNAVLGIVRRGRLDVNLQLLRDGYAWARRDHPEMARGKELAAAEELARSKRRGLWKEAAPTPPSAFSAEAPAPALDAGRVDEPSEGVFTDPTTGMAFVLVKGGCFRMGSRHWDDEERIHDVCVDDFYMGRCEVTQEEWAVLMGTNPSRFRKGGKYPVEQVSYDDAQSFIAALNARSGAAYRLPTEAEWEYAARSGGRPDEHSGPSEGPELAKDAWFADNAGGSTHKAGTKRSNGAGLHDMSGNVREWTQDWYARDYQSWHEKENPTGPPSGEIRVLRGGSWSDGRRALRTRYRDAAYPSTRRDDIGFRLAFPRK